MRSFFHNPALIHNDNSIRRAYGRKPVRDDDRGAMLHQTVERVLYKTLAFRIQSRGRFIE